MFNEFCNQNDPTRNTLNIHELKFDNYTISRLATCCVYNPHWLLLDNLLHLDDDSKHTPRRNLIRLKSLTAGHGALDYLQAILTCKKLTRPNGILIIAVRRTLRWPLLLSPCRQLPLLLWQTKQRTSLGTLQKCSLHQTTQQYSWRVQILTRLPSHVQSSKRTTRWARSCRRPDPTHPTDDNAYRYFDFTTAPPLHRHSQ